KVSFATKAGIVALIHEPQEISMHHRTSHRHLLHNVLPAFLFIFCAVLLGSVALPRPVSAQAFACLDLDMNGYCDDTGALIVDNAQGTQPAPSCTSDADCSVENSFCYQQVACACWDTDHDGVCDSADSGDTKGGGGVWKPRIPPGGSAPDVECP